MLFFFFQAEDGIRDTSVTGVQTCALPIPLRLERRVPRLQGDRDGPCAGRGGGGGGEPRSEERRVGKECRSRWSAYHLKKKEQKRRVSGECGKCSSELRDGSDSDMKRER